MSRPSLLVLFLSLFLLSSCSSEVELTCAQTQGVLQTYNLILKTFGIETRSLNKQNEVCLFVSRRDLSFSLGVINQIKLYEVGSEDDHNILKQLVPVLQSSLDKTMVELQKIKKVPGVVSFNCRNMADFDCTIWFHSKVIKENHLYTHIPELVREKVKLHDIQNDLSQYFSKTSNNLNSSLDVAILEPFSFHVSKDEKNIASVQLTIVLAVFLLSGFVIGFWFGSRDGKVKKNEE